MSRDFPRPEEGSRAAALEHIAQLKRAIVEEKQRNGRHTLYKVRRLEHELKMFIRLMQKRGIL